MTACLAEELFVNSSSWEHKALTVSGTAKRVGVCEEFNLKGR